MSSTASICGSTGKNENVTGSTSLNFLIAHYNSKKVLSSNPQSISIQFTNNMYNNLLLNI